MKDKLLIVLIIFTAICVVCAVKVRNIGDERSVYAVLPLTGNIAEAGSHYKHTIQMYLSKLQKSNFNVSYVDSCFDPRKANAALIQSISVEQAPIVLTAITSISEALLATVKSRSGFQVCISTLESMTNSEDTCYQRISTTSLDGIFPLIAAAQRENSKVSVIYSHNDYGINVRNLIRSECEKKHLQLVSESEYNLGDPDVRGSVFRLLEGKQPDAVFVCGASTPAYINIFKTLEDLRFAGKIYADGIFTVPTVRKALSNRIQQQVIFPCFDAYLTVPKTAKGQSFKQLCSTEAIEPYFVVVETVVALEVLDRIIGQGKDVNRSSFRELGVFDSITGSVDLTMDGSARFSYILAHIDSSGSVIQL